MPEDRDALVEEPWQAFRRFCHPPLYWFDESGWKARFAALASILPPTTSAGDGELVERLREASGFAEANAAHFPWVCRTAPLEAVAELSRLTARVKELEEALALQPIGTAPKDGTIILGYSEASPTYFHAIVWEDDEWRYCSQGVGWAAPASAPTHWAKLPALNPSPTGQGEPG